MSRTDLHAGLTSPDAESLRSFTETLPDEYHEWVTESGRSSRLVATIDTVRSSSLTSTATIKP